MGRKWSWMPGPKVSFRDLSRRKISVGCFCGFEGEGQLTSALHGDVGQSWCSQHSQGSLACFASQCLMLRVFERSSSSKKNIFLFLKVVNKRFFFSFCGGEEFIFSKNDFFKEWLKTKRSGTTHGLWKLRWLSKQGNRGLKLHWQQKDPSRLWEAEESYFMGGGITLSAVRAEHRVRASACGLRGRCSLSCRTNVGAWRGKQKQSWVCWGDWSTSPCLYLSQLKLLFKLSSIVIYLSYIHKTGSGWAASVKAILVGIRNIVL